MVEAQVRAVQELAKRARERVVMRGERDRGRQAGRDVDGEGRAGQDRRRASWRGLRENLGHKVVRAALDALRAGDERRKPRKAGKALRKLTGRLSGGREKDRIASGKPRKLAGRENALGKFCLRKLGQ